MEGLGKYIRMILLQGSVGELSYKILNTPAFFLLHLGVVASEQGAFGSPTLILTFYAVKKSSYFHLNSFNWRKSGHSRNNYFCKKILFILLLTLRGVKYSFSTIYSRFPSSTNLKKAGGLIGWNVVEITIKMKTIVRKPFMIKSIFYL